MMDEKMLVVGFDFTRPSDELKPQLCMTIHEYLLAAIEEATLHSAIESNVFGRLASTAIHLPENRMFFIKSRSKERIRAVMDLLAYTGNPMTPIF
jgi:hypothetical protein